MTRLRRVSRADLDISRQRRGRGYSYHDADGQPLRDRAIVDRVFALGIPPAWTEVRIARDPVAHIQACGIDAAGRVQYIYHPEWEARRVRKKQRQLALLTAALPASAAT